MKNLKKDFQKKMKLFLFLFILLMNSFISVTWADTTNDYHVVLTETAAQIQQSDSNPGINSSWSIIGLVRCNATVPQEYYNTFYQNVLKGLIDCGGQLTTTRYTEYSKLILSVTAIGKDAQNVGGYNLLSYLSNYDHVSKQGINGTIWALIAVNAKSTYDFPKEKGVAVLTTKKLLVDKILAAELKTGGFTLYGNEADVDMTAMAVQALAPYYNSRTDVKAVIDRALVILSGKQNSTGDYQSGGISNAESTAQVLTALSALSIDAASDSRYVKNSKSVLSGLLSYYLGNGIFSHTGGGSSNALATQQSFYALAAYNCFQKGGKLYDMEDIPNNPDNNDTESTEKPTIPITPTNTTPTNTTPTNTTPTNTTPTNTTSEDTRTEPDTTVATANETEGTVAISVNTDNQTAEQSPSIQKEDTGTVLAASNQSDAGKAGNSTNSVVVSKDTFVGLQGKNTNYEINGKTADGVIYSWTFHGTDIKTPMDFDGTIVLGGDYASQINELADAPFVFKVGQQAFPGEALLKLTTTLSDGSYGLFSYDEKAQTAKLLQKVKVESGQTRCILAKGGNYYIAAKSKAALATAQEAVTETQKAVLTGAPDSNAANRKNTSSNSNESKISVRKVTLFVTILAILIGLFAICVNKVSKSKNQAKQFEEAKNHENEKQENNI